MRVAHIIITHKNPLQLERLLRKMQHSDFDFYIHLDKKMDIRPFEYLKEINGVNFIQNRVVCNWGGYSTLQAMVNSLREVVENTVDYGFYNLLSGQDYPLKSNEEIVAFFSAHAEKSFIFYETKYAAEWWETAVYRFQRYHLTDFNFTGKSFLERIINELLPKRKFPMEMELFGGSKSSWWSINKDSAVYLTDFFKRENKIDKFLKFCWGTDEFVIPTILVNSPLKESLVNDNLRFIDFPEGSANPRILGTVDFKEIMESEMLFARKFDITVNDEILDQIDAYPRVIK